MKLARKLALALIVGVTLVLVVSAYLRVQREIGLFESDMRRDDRMMARALRAAVSEVWRSEGEAAALRVVEVANAHESSVTIRWVLAGAPPDHPLRAKADGAATSAAAQDETVEERLAIEDGREELVTYIGVRVPDGRLGAIELSESLDGEREYVNQTILHAITSTGIVALVCALLTTAAGVLLVGRPMHRLAEQARRVGTGDLSGRLQLEQRDEIGELAMEMNAMCERLAVAQGKIESETTARIGALEQLRHADRLATVGRLASGIAHELGTPLQVVSGRARMITDGDLTPEEVTESAHIIHEQARRITKIIRQLLDFARHRRADKVKVDLEALTAQTCALLSTIADKKQVTLKATTGKGGIEAQVDPEQLQQALTNLLVNAIDATPPGTRVSIDVGVERATPPVDHGGAPGDFIHIAVRDEGPGMPAGVAERVFEPFFTTKPVGLGTGLGLSVSYGIVSEHGGWMAAESPPGGGSRFSIYLPCKASA